MDDCVFCQVLRDENHPQIIERGKYVTVIRKHYQSKNVNFLIIANEHIINYKDATAEQRRNVASETVEMANKLLPGLDWSMKNNNGAKSSQTVFHLHTHIYCSAPWPKNF